MAVSAGIERFGTGRLYSGIRVQGLCEYSFQMNHFQFLGAHSTFRTLVGESGTRLAERAVEAERLGPWEDSLVILDRFVRPIARTK